ncbi:MAG: hypothetical protein GY842_15385, partial [bacterium]|nr:hypothetical protein [bacterium]
MGDYWTKDELVDSLCGAGGSSYKFSNLNGHATHWEIGFPGAGSAGKYGLLTSELVDTNVCGPPDLAGNLFYAADCHGGLSVPQTEPEGKTLDLPQAFASLGVSAYLANSGFGWGLRCGLGYSELLVQMFTEELIDRGISTVGEAVNEAKSRYYTETLLLDNYDLKTLRQWRLTGIPNLELRVGPPASAPARWVDDGTGVERLGPVTVTRQVSGGAATAGRETDPSLPDHMTVLKLDFNLSADDVYTKYRTSGEEITGSCLPFPAAGQEPADRVQCQGCYYTWNGHHSTGEADLPVQPYVAYESNLDDLIRQGVLWKGARYEVEEDWAPTFGWLSSEGELPPNPVSLPRRVYIKPRGRYAPATKAATCVPAGENTGPIVFTTAEVEDDPDVLADYSILKLHRHVDLEVFYLPESGAGNPSCDQAGPIFGPALDGSDDYHDLEDDLLHWKVPMFDTSGVWRVLLVYDDNTVDAQGYGRWQPLELVEESPGVWSASLQLTDTSHVSYYLQAVDELGNVSWLLQNLDLPPSGIPFELPKLVDVTVPSVSVPWVDGAEGMTVDITVEIEPRKEMVAALAFSLDYDEACLDPDLDDNGILDDFLFTVPQGFTIELEFDPAGASGEIAVSIYDPSGPIGALPAGELLRVSFKVICSAPLATVSFSSVTFGDDWGQNLPGSGVSGGVRILSGLRGDCNGSGKVEVPDFTALGLEIDDGDGVFWADAIGGTFPGSPIGCDANANTEINAADLTCIS